MASFAQNAQIKFTSILHVWTNVQMAFTKTLTLIVFQFVRNVERDAKIV